MPDRPRSQGRPAGAGARGRIPEERLWQLGFVVGSVLCGFSQNMEQLISFRVLQGLGMGGVQALGQVVVGALLSPRERGRYSGYTGMVISAGTVGGPLVGGFLVDWPGWRWCFFVCVPLALVALCWTAVPLALVQLAELVRPVFVPRYLLPALLGVAVLTAVGAAGWRRAVAVPAVGLLLAGSGAAAGARAGAVGAMPATIAKVAVMGGICGAGGTAQAR